MRGSAVEVPDRGVEGGGEGDPGDVGGPEVGGEFVEALEAESEVNEEGEEEDDIGEGEAGLAEAEEDDGPEGVEGELGKPEGEQALGGGLFAAVPDAPGDDGHEGVEGGPDGAEETSGGSPVGFKEFGIPGFDAGGGGDATDEAGGEGAEEEAGEDEDGALERSHGSRWKVKRCEERRMEVREREGEAGQVRG